MRSHSHDIIIAFLLGASSVERIILQRCLVFISWNRKTSCLSDKKVRRKNQILEYHASSPKRYNEEDTKSIDEKHSNPMEY